MQLNENAMQVLKNFATINPNIVIEEGNIVRTLSEGKNIFGKAVVDLDFPVKFGIYDLNEFLNVLGLVDHLYKLLLFHKTKFLFIIPI